MTPADIAAALTSAQVLNEIEAWLDAGNWQQTSGPYSHKNNQCEHGQFGYEGCEGCMENGLRKFIAARLAVLAELDKGVTA